MDSLLNHQENNTWVIFSTIYIMVKEFILIQMGINFKVHTKMVGDGDMESLLRKTEKFILGTLLIMKNMGLES